MINLEDYDSIIFDFGGVIININYHLSVLAFEKLGFQKFDNWYAQAGQDKLFDNLETGQISENEFYDEVRNISKLQLTNEQIKNAWNALLLDLPIQRIELLKQLSKSHKIFLLSNTNQIHANDFAEKIDGNYGWENFKSIFNNTYLSHEIKMRKPNADAFEFVLNQNNLVCSKTLFIDDSIQHIEGAKKVGINAYYLNPNEKNSILDLF